MSNIPIIDGAEDLKYVKASGAGTDIDPHVPEQAITVASLPLPSGAATSAKQDTEIASLATLAGAVSGTEVQVDIASAPTLTVQGTVTASGPLTDTQLRASAVPVSGTVTANPAVQALTTTAGTKAASGDQELIAAPSAGHHIVVSSIMLQNETAVATTLLLKDGSTTKRRALLQNQGDGVAWAFPVGREWHLADAAALNLNLSAANSHGYVIDYWTT